MTVLEELQAEKLEDVKKKFAEYKKALAEYKDIELISECAKVSMPIRFIAENVAEIMKGFEANEE